MTAEAGDGGLVAARASVSTEIAIQPVRAWPSRRQLLVTALFAAFLVYAASEFVGPSAERLDLSHAQWGWIPVAIGLQAVCFALYGGLYHHGFRAVGVEAAARRMVKVLFASIFLKTVVPLAGATALVVFIDDANAHGQSGPRAAAGSIVVTAIDLVASLPFVGAGILALAVRDRLAPYDSAGAAIFTAFVAVLVGALVLAAVRPGLLDRLLRIAQALVNRAGRIAGRRQLVPEAWVHRSAEHFADAAAAVPRHPRSVGTALGFSLGLHLVNALSLAALFLAFGLQPRPDVVIAGLGASIVFFVVAVVPDGIGAVEGAMALVFVSLGVPPAVAILVTLAYRVLNVWIPVALGYVFARQLRLFGGRGVATA